MRQLILIRDAEGLNWICADIGKILLRFLWRLLARLDDKNRMRLVEDFPPLLSVFFKDI